MSKRFFAKTMLFAAITALSAMPIMSSAKTNSPSYIFRSTSVGAGLQEYDGHKSRIVNPKTSFSSGEWVYVMSRIFKIDHVDNFRFRHELFRSGDDLKIRKDSPTYYPRGRWWAETWYWTNFTDVPDGTYTLKTYVSVDGGRFEVKKKQTIKIGTGQIAYVPPVYYGVPSYNFSFLKTGTGVYQASQYGYEISGERNTYAVNESVWALVKINDLRYADYFRMKIEAYKYGTTFYSASSQDVLYPRGEYWAQNSFYTNFGPMPEGSHEIRAYISVNGGSFQYLGSRQITVVGTGGGGVVAKNYRYNWTKTGNDIYYGGNGQYYLRNERTQFRNNEPVIALVSLSDISGVDKYNVEFELYRRNSAVLEARKMGDKFSPHYTLVAQSFSSAIFSPLSVGDYTVKTYLRYDDNYVQLDSINFSVYNPYYQN